MKYKFMRKSCEIFEKYEADGYFESDYDIIYGPGIDTEFTLEDKEKLESLGWWLSDNYDCWCC